MREKIGTERYGKVGRGLRVLFFSESLSAVTILGLPFVMTVLAYRAGFLPRQVLVVGWMLMLLMMLAGTMLKLVGLFRATLPHRNYDIAFF